MKLKKTNIEEDACENGSTREKLKVDDKDNGWKEARSRNKCSRTKTSIIITCNTDNRCNSLIKSNRCDEETLLETVKSKE